MFNPADHYVHVLAITKDDEEVARARIQQICTEFKDSDEGY